MFIHQGDTAHRIFMAFLINFMQHTLSDIVASWFEESLNSCYYTQMWLLDFKLTLQAPEVTWNSFLQGFDDEDQCFSFPFITSVFGQTGLPHSQDSR